MLGHTYTTIPNIKKIQRSSPKKWTKNNFLKSIISDINYWQFQCIFFSTTMFAIFPGAKALVIHTMTDCNTCCNEATFDIVSKVSVRKKKKTGHRKNYINTSWWCSYLSLYKPIFIYICRSRHFYRTKLRVHRVLFLLKLNKSTTEVRWTQGPPRVSIYRSWKLKKRKKIV